MFPLWLIDKYFSQVWAELGITRDQFIDLGKQTQPWGETFVMPVLALHLSERANAVSELHSHVSKKMWSFLWPDRKEENVPIGYVTNGVHTGTWLARRMGLLFDQYLGPDWRAHLDDPVFWESAKNIPDKELWAVRRHLKNKLVNFANERTRQTWLNGVITPSQAIAGGVFLEPYSLTIGFARRFATYKRAPLIFQQFDNIVKLAHDKQRPVQFIFAGKAHPRDDEGKRFIQQIIHLSKQGELVGSLVFVENYDVHIARQMVSGCDVWLNNPRRPLEASGTSGMKASANGVVNLSVLDGWWDEGWLGDNGWAIGGRETNPDEGAQDFADAQDLYRLLEQEVVPLYFGRNEDDVPTGWTAEMRRSIASTLWRFSTIRMLHEYVEKMYLPAAGVEVKKSPSRRPAADPS